jgi:hypothetical protein
VNVSRHQEKNKPDLCRATAALLKPAPMRIAARFAVQMMPTRKIRSSPENDTLYGKFDATTDPTFAFLVDSIKRRGLEEPIILTVDGYVLSGHRRLHACRRLNMRTVPVRVKKHVRRNGNSGFVRELSDFNPQRIKGPGPLLREALLRFSSEKDAVAIIAQWEQKRRPRPAEYRPVDGQKRIAAITSSRREFMDAVKAVVNRLADYWRLTLRQIHYQLLNDPPMTLTPRRSSASVESTYRYANTPASYRKLSELCVSARYLGEISMDCIDDPTRPHFFNPGFESVAEFLRSETENFMTGYHRNRQQDQPLHIEVFGEKNTICQILRPVCEEFHVPLTIGRGFSSLPVWRDMARRFEESRRSRLVLLVASDHDPEGFELADDAIRSLRLWDIDASYHRVAVNRTQIEELDLSEDFNAAKEASSRYKKFVADTGSTKTWEIEALPPEYLQNALAGAITANMDTALYDQVVAQEQEDIRSIHGLRQEFAASLGVGAIEP